MGNMFTDTEVKLCYLRHLFSQSINHNTSHIQIQTECSSHVGSSTERCVVVIIIIVIITIGLIIKL